MSALQTAASRVAGLVGRESWLIRRMRPAYESLLEWSGGGRGAAWTVNGVEYRVDPHYRHRLGPSYDAPVAAFLRARVRPGAVCVDVGANVGVYVLQFAHWSAPAGRVVAFEPNPGARAVLERHVRFNGLEGRVTVVPAAVSACAGSATLYAEGADGKSRLGEPHAEMAGRARAVVVPTVTLDEYCAAAQVEPDWLFIDIEGFEVAALSGARGLIKALGRRVGIVVELHPNVWHTVGTSRAELERLLEELGLDPMPLTGQADALGEHGLVHLSHREAPR
ncbi:MAG TPA: FkbM family methyltransferase [Pyrinomonadaceae bacterium]